MPTNRFCTVLFTILLGVSQSACKKDSTNSKTNTQLLTEQSWTLTGFRYNSNNGPWTDGFVTIPNCQKDNKLSFQTNFSYILDEGATKCNSADPQIFQQGNWSFMSNETKLATIYNGSTGIVDIILLDNTTLKTSRKDTVGINTVINEATYNR